MPLVKVVLKWLTSGSCVSDVLLKLYECLMKIDKFKEAVELAVVHGVEIALNFLKDVKDELIKACQEDKELTKALSKGATKSVVRYMAVGPSAKLAFKLGASKVGSQTIKSAMKIANPLGLVADGTQGVLEYCGYEKEGKAIGKWGNIGTSALAGFMIGDSVINKLLLFMTINACI